MKILIVEDAPSDLKLARVLLMSAGHEVSEAETAEMALTAVRENPPELILLDLKLPGTDGLTLLRQLKQDRMTQEIPVVAVTSYPDYWTQQQALEAGCRAYLTKPIDAKALVLRISDIGFERST
jgi:CheY-like chemotaxis protein